MSRGSVVPMWLHMISKCIFHNSGWASTRCGLIFLALLAEKVKKLFTVTKPYPNLRALSMEFLALK